MPRNMSFALTIAPFVARTKTVTRRFGWIFLKPGDIVCGVEKTMGFKKGERIVRLGMIRIVSVRREPLEDITPKECEKEGFPDLSPEEFIAMLCRHSKCSRHDSVNRIEFVHLVEEGRKP